MRKGREKGRVIQFYLNTPFPVMQAIHRLFLGALSVHKSLDREHCAAYNLSIAAVDVTRNNVSSECTVVISVDDVNDNPPRFEMPFYEVYVSESAPIGTEIIQVRATIEYFSKSFQKIFLFLHRADASPISSFLFTFIYKFIYEKWRSNRAIKKEGKRMKAKMCGREANLLATNRRFVRKLLLFAVWMRREIDCKTPRKSAL